MMAVSFMALKRRTFVWVRLAIRGLVSVAPKNAIPINVVSQSKVPMRMRVVQNTTSLLTILPYPC